MLTVSSGKVPGVEDTAANDVFMPSQVFTERYWVQGEVENLSLHFAAWSLECSSVRLWDFELGLFDLSDP